MATLIICPVCQTRYETQAVFPPGGRKVRCSKCAHVWQAMPVVAPPPVQTPTPMPQPAAPPQAVPTPPPSPQPAGAVNAAMRGFAGIAPTPPPPPASSPGLTQAAVEADLAAQVARINAEAAMAEADVAEPEAEKVSGGIFARLTRKGAPIPSAPPMDASMDEGAMAGAGRGETSLSNGGMADAGMGDASLSDAEMGIDPALAAQAFPEERPPRKKLSVVTIGWLLLALIVGSVIGTLVLAPSTVLSVLPGASRLYALLGMPTGGQGLAFQGVRYGWTNDGGQPVLEVQGDVVNLTASPVDVPTVVIALRDEKGEEISEWTTEIGAEQLGGGEHAPFLRQIPSPPSNVRSVKVRFSSAE